MRSATVSTTALATAFVWVAACTAAKPNFAPDATLQDGGPRDGGGIEPDARPPDGGVCARFGTASCASAGECETYTWADEARCGDCTTSCEATRLCVAGACRSPIATELALGADFTCALLTSGHIVCWGRDNQGQLGDRSFAPDDQGRSDAVAVEGIDDAVAIDASGSTACAIRGLERVVDCWGDNRFDKFGAPGVTPANLRQGLRFAADPAPVEQVSVSDQHICVRTDTAVLCSGGNQNGQLGRPDTSLRTRLLLPVPGLPAGAPRWVEAATASLAGFTCVAAADGQVYCFGANDSGQLGRDPAAVVMSDTPEPIPGLSGIVQLASGIGFVCARDGAGAVYCWGRNESGQLGSGMVDDEDHYMPVQVMGLPPIGAIAAGGSFMLAVSQGGAEVWGWGARDDGQLGMGDLMLDATGTPAPLRMVGGATYRAYAGTRHSFLIEQQAGVLTILCAGSNFRLQLGLDGTESRTRFTATEALP